MKTWVVYSCEPAFFCCRWTVRCHKNYPGSQCFSLASWVCGMEIKKFCWLSLEMRRCRDSIFGAEPKPSPIVHCGGYNDSAASALQRRLAVNICDIRQLYCFACDPEWCFVKKRRADSCFVKFELFSQFEDAKEDVSTVKGITVTSLITVFHSKLRQHEVRSGFVIRPMLSAEPMACACLPFICS